jgi:hypothetical protein
VLDEIPVEQVMALSPEALIATVHDRIARELDEPTRNVGATRAAALASSTR